MAGLVLLLDRRDDARSQLVATLARLGVTVIAAGTTAGAITKTALRGVRPDAIVVVPSTLGADRGAFLAAHASHPLLAGVPLLVLGESVDEPATARVRTVPELLTALAAVWRAPAMPPAPARVATGTGGIAQVTEEMPELHDYVHGKLVQYLGPVRATATLDAVLRELRVTQITTTADLYRIAGALSARGALEAAVAALISGRATLIDSDRTLRSS